jgi:hypothetical protein
VFTREDKLVREAVGYEQQTAEAALSQIGFAACEPAFQRRLWPTDFSEEKKMAVPW